MGAEVSIPSQASSNGWNFSPGPWYADVHIWLLVLQWWWGSVFLPPAGSNTVISLGWDRLARALSEWHLSLVLEPGLNSYQHNMSANSALWHALMQRERRVSEQKCYIFLAEATCFTRCIICRLLHCASLITVTFLDPFKGEGKKPQVALWFSDMLNFLPLINSSPPSFSRFCFLTLEEWFLERKRK